METVNSKSPVPSISGADSGAHCAVDADVVDIALANTTGLPQQFSEWVPDGAPPRTPGSFGTMYHLRNSFPLSAAVCFFLACLAVV